VPNFGHFGPGHFAALPDRLLAAKALERFQEPGHHDVVQVLAFEQGEPRRAAKARVGAHHPQADVPGQIAEQIEGESDDVMGAGTVAGP
jgi:hypothetical protein